MTAAHQIAERVREYWYRTPARLRKCGTVAGRLAIDLLFPPLCTYCRSDVTHNPLGVMLCTACLQRFRPRRRACSRCASPLPPFWGGQAFCPACRHRKYHFAKAVALGDYQRELQQAVLSMKRLAFEPLTRDMGRLLAGVVVEELQGWQPNEVVPVPMHIWRRLARGTQASLTLGESIAKQCSLPLSSGLLKCSRKPLKQGTLSPSQRFRNIRGAFRISPGYDITDKRILLVDDVMTTGATASEAARMLRGAGAESVAVAVIARGTGRR